VSKELLAERAKFMNFSARMRKMADKNVMAGTSFIFSRSLTFV
jgi:formate dehydrogenase assembly factor FdhD